MVSEVLFALRGMYKLTSYAPRMKVLFYTSTRI